MDDIKGLVNRIVLDPEYADFLAILKGARNGAVYGAKVRFPHALVMVFLFRSGSLRSKLALIIKATRQHARNLALFATFYKSTMLLQRRLLSDANKQASWHPFVAGLVGGYAVFGRGIQSSVNQQIVIYVFARVVLALAKMAFGNTAGGNAPAGTRGAGAGRSGLLTKEGVTRNAWPVFASLSWACVMWIFNTEPETLQPSLKSSMKYMYAIPPGLLKVRDDRANRGTCCEQI
ncbi:MAG: hypothetical protein M4579_000743 [Chaenotheca gracillima]|nr:MAG: hypothetical protein M4579_000743 [Chaenotheca gracillima]